MVVFDLAIVSVNNFGLVLVDLFATSDSLNVALFKTSVNIFLNMIQRVKHHKPGPCMFFKLQMPADNYIVSNNVHLIADIQAINRDGANAIGKTGST